MTSQNLTYSMRSSLLSLQSIAQQTSAVQKVLSTGKKVSTVLDNPSSYYTAASLSHRAADLNLLLDSMGEAISALKNATQALETSIGFLELAKSAASNSLFESPEYSPDDPPPVPPTPPDPSKTSVTKEVMKQIMTDEGISGFVVSTAQELKEALTKAKSGDNIVIIGSIDMGTEQISVGNGVRLAGADAIIRDESLNNQYEVSAAAKAHLSFDYGQDGAAGKTYAIDMGTNSTASDISFDFDNKYNASLFNATTSGIKLHNIDIDMNSLAGFGSAGGLINITGDVSMSGVNNIKMSGKTLTWNLSMATYAGKLYVDRDAVINIDGGGEGNVTRGGNVFMNGTINAKNISSVFVYANGTTGAVVNGTINVKNHTGNNLFANTKLNLQSNAVINAAAGDKTELLSEVSTNYQSGAVVNFYKNGIISTWEAKGNGSYTGNITLGGSSDLDAVSTNWKKTTRPGREEDILGNLVITDDEGAAGTDFRGSSQKFNKILGQYAGIISDGSYLGNNLLLKQNLKVVFNENSSSYLKIKGVDASLNGLNLSFVDWNSHADIQTTIGQLDEAISELRNYSREFGNYYTTVSIREDFTNSMIDILQEGADKLTLADMNQASADMLSLQTRQQLAVNSLSLASQASRNVMKLFM